MSRNENSPIQKTDQRVQKTQEILGDALLSLMMEKPYDRITIREVLERAEVGRSTFYAHYLHKDDLFLSDVEMFWKMMASMPVKGGSVRILAVRELFAHAAEAREIIAALKSSTKINDVYDLGKEYFARTIEDRLLRLKESGTALAGNPSLLAQMLSGSLFSLLSWWLENTNEYTPQEMDDQFHQFFWSTITRAKTSIVL